MLSEPLKLLQRLKAVTKEGMGQGPNARNLVRYQGPGLILGGAVPGVEVDHRLSLLWGRVM